MEFNTFLQIQLQLHRPVADEAKLIAIESLCRMEQFYATVVSRQSSMNTEQLLGVSVLLKDWLQSCFIFLQF